MRRLARRIHWDVFTNPAESRIHLHLGDDRVSLTAGEAVDMANRLIDRVEQLRTERRTR